jgi:hypothetical protein
MSVTVKWYGDRVKRQVREAAARGLSLGTEHVGQVASSLAPIEEGTLEKDWAPSIDESKLMAVVAFGIGGASDYALRQHEEMDWNHDAGRQAKYLEQPLNTERAKVLALIHRETKRTVGG